MKKSLEQRINAAIREKIRMVPYDPRWPQIFEAEKEFLRSKFPRPLLKRIEHFGSTAIPGLTAKPIVDMLIEVNSLSATKRHIVPVLESEGYDYFWREDCSPAYAWFIKRNSKGIRTHHLHMVEANSKLWERLFFRDYLREFPNEAQRYEDLKRDLAEKYPNDRVAYTEGKTEFIVPLTEKARRYYN